MNRNKLLGAAAIPFAALGLWIGSKFGFIAGFGSLSLLYYVLKRLQDESVKEQNLGVEEDWRISVAGVAIIVIIGFVVVQLLKA